MVNALPSGVAVSPRAVANLKRSMVMSLPCGLLALVLLSLVGHPLAGLFVVLGMAFGVLNGRLMQLSVLRYGYTGSKGGFLVGVVSRLLLMTAAALGAIALVRPDGAGLLVGLAIFQAISLLGAAVPVLRELRR